MNLRPVHRPIATGLVAVLLALPLASQAALSTYRQNFEGLSQFDFGALGADGWQVYASVLSPDRSTLLYGYGPFPAPNDGGGFSAIAAGFGGPTQGGQHLSVFSDYLNSGAHQSGQIVDSSVFQLQTVGAADIGSTWRLRFDAVSGGIEAPSTAQAYVLTLDPLNGYALTSHVILDTTAVTGAWGSYEVSLSISDPALEGQLLQFGFATSATGYAPSAVLYDNVRFTAAVPEPSIAAMMLAGVVAFSAVARTRAKSAGSNRRS